MAPATQLPAARTRFTTGRNIPAFLKRAAVAAALLCLAYLPAHAQGVTVTPTSLTFTSQLVGTTSAAQMVTVKNAGTAEVTITSATAPAPFSVGTNCNSKKLAGGASCTFNVTFKPTAAGAANATLTVAFASPVASQTVSLSGTGTAPVASASPATLTFNPQQVGTASAAQTVTLSNTGTAPLQINNISIGGTNPANFSETNTCGTFPVTLAINGSCTISVTFMPNATGTRSANLTLTFAKPQNPQTITVALSGTGVAPSASLNPMTLPFGNQTVNSQSPAQTVTLTNTGSGPLTVSNIALTGANAGNFVITADACVNATAPPFPSTVAASCTINVAFKPGSTGAKSATLSVTVKYLSSALSASLTGTGTTGTGTPPAFTSANNTTFTVGVAGTFTPTASGSPVPTITESGALPSGVSFAGGALSGTPTQAGTFNITFTATNSAGTGTQPFTLTVNKGTATVTLGNMTQTYTGSALSPTVTTSPAGLATSLTGAPDTNAGSYAVTATVTNPNYTGSASGTFVVNKAAATVTLGSLTQTYTATALSPTVTTSPAGLATSLTGAPDTNAGSYPVTATITNPNYTGSANGTFVISQAAATVTLGNLTQTYNGSALSPTVTTSPAGLATSLTGAPDTNAGSYPVTAAVTDPNYTGSANGTFVISQAAATVTATAASKTYGAADPALNVTETGFTAADAATITLSARRAAGENVGTYAITPSASGAALTNYNVTYTPASFTINAANATVTASAASKTYGAADPALTATETGFTPADAATITLSATRAAGENVGTYTITPLATGTAAANYSITYVSANFTITQATPVFSGLTASQSITFGAPSIALSGTIAAGTLYPPNTETVSITINGSTVAASIGSNGSFSTNFITSAIPASTTPYTIAYGYAGDADFSSASDSSTNLTVGAAAVTLQSITVTPANSAIALGATQAFTATGHNSDGTTTDLTGTATWSSSVTSSATMSANAATAASTGCGGPTTISATSGSVVGSTGLTVTIPGGFSCSGNMTTARDPHTSTLLNNGLILITGGYGSTPFVGFVLNAAELWDASTGSSTPTPTPYMNDQRANHTATLLNNGQVLIVGGVSSDGVTPLYSMEIYDPASGNFIKWSYRTGVFLNYARYSHTATLLADGTVLIAGGIGDSSGNPTNTAEIYNPATGTFTVLPNMNSPRANHTATLLSDGKSVLVAGGATDSSGNPTNSAEVYYNGTFYPTGLLSGQPAAVTMSTPRSQHTATLLTSGPYVGKILIAGGQSCAGGCPVQPAEFYDFNADAFVPATDTFNNQEYLNVARYGHTATMLTNATVLFAGGVDSSGSPSAAAELYDLASGTFTLTTSLQTARYYQTATLYLSKGSPLSGSVLLAGGTNTSGPLASTELYTPSNPTPFGLQSIFITPASPSIPIGTTQRFTANAVFQSGQPGALRVAWSSSDPTILAIGNDSTNAGLGYPVAAGAVTVTACAGTVCGSTNVTVTPPALVSITVSPANPFVSVPPGGTVTFTAQGAYTDGSVADVTGAPTTWSSSDTTIATVSGNVATPVGAFGSATVTATQTSITSAVISASTTLTVSNVISTGNLITPRYFATSTLMNDGTVLITGGTPSGGGAVAQAELYSAGVFSTPASATLNTPRSGATATLLDNGQVLISGGGYPAAELYNPVTQTFSNTGSMTTNRSSNTATLIKCSCVNNGKVLITGGTDSSGNFDKTAELYDPATGTFRLTGSMTTGRQVHTATMLNNGKVLIAGGYAGQAQFGGGFTTDSAELYDPTNETFTPTGSMADYGAAKGRGQHTATLLNDGTVLFAGGWAADTTGSLTIPGSAELYDPSTGTFKPVGAMVYTLYDHTATLLNNGTVLFAGGIATNASNANAPNNQIYDPVTQTFSLTGSLQYPRYDHTATLLSNGNVLIAGGIPVVAAAELFQPATLTPASVTSITVTPNVVNLPLGTAQNFIATDQAGHQLASVTWSSSDPNMTITNDSSNSGTGYVVGSGGAPIIKACLGALCGSTTGVTVATLGTITVSPNPASVFLGNFAQTQQFTATGNFGGGVMKDITGLVTWSSSPSGFATIGNAPSATPGLATPVAVGGPTTISATFGGITGTATLNVTPPPLVSVEITPPNSGLWPTGSSEQLTATAQYADGSTLNVTTGAGTLWTSSNNGAVTISGTGLATAQAQGSSTIQASYNNINGLTTVTVPNTGFNLGPAGLDVANHTATLLNNGKVLIAGGNTTVSPQSPVAPQLYDPATQTLTPTGSMVIPRSQHHATLLNDGTVLITGGYDSSYNATYVAEVFDPAAGTFATTPINSPTYFIDNTATLLNDGTVLLTGGIPGPYLTPPINGAWIYNPGNHSFTPTAKPMNAARWSHTATLLNDGKVLIAGGEDANFNPLASAELYDPATGTFTATTASMITAHAYHTATLLNSGQVLLAGCAPPNGSASTSAELYDPVAGTFTATGSMNVPRCFHTATLMTDGTVLVEGGYNSFTQTSNSAEVYDPILGTFSVTANLNTGRYNFSATRLVSGTVLVTGGQTGPTTPELYTPSTFTPPNLVSIAISPASPDIAAIGGTQRFIATGTFSVGNPQQLATVTWSAADLAGVNVAQISNDASDPGVAVGQSQGRSTIMACTGAVCGSTTLTVGVLAYGQTVPTNPPGTRCCMAMVFDPVSNSTLLFGGVLSPPSANYIDVGDTWQFQNGQWTQLSGSAPSAREGAAMVYDAATNNIVLFGGNDGTKDLNDTWIWNGTTLTWTQVTPATPPPARHFEGQGLAYHAGTRTVVMFGGQSTAGYFGDTWTWDGTNWTQQTVSTSPSARRVAAMSSDPSGNVLLFGGGAAAQSLNDTWVWNGTAWQQQSPATSPAPRGLAGMVLDPDLNEVVLFGGSSTSYYNDTWIWNGRNWTQVFPSGAQPHDRYAFGIDYDTAQKAVVIFGGYSSLPALNDTWELFLLP